MGDGSSTLHRPASELPSTRKHPFVSIDINADTHINQLKMKMHRLQSKMIIVLYFSIDHHQRQYQ
jgi:hypothetical protein